jgi:hypothetical protein
MVRMQQIQFYIQLVLIKTAFGNSEITILSFRSIQNVQELSVDTKLQHSKRKLMTLYYKFEMG